MSAPSDAPDFTLDFHSEVNSPAENEKLRSEAETSLRKLMKGHTDITGGMVSIKVPQPADPRGTPSTYNVTVTAYVRPENVAAHEDADSVEMALRRALKAVERQIREKRERLRNH